MRVCPLTVYWLTLPLPVGSSSQEPTWSKTRCQRPTGGAPPYCGCALAASAGVTTRVHVAASAAGGSGAAVTRAVVVTSNSPADVVARTVNLCSPGVSHVVISQPGSTPP